jgi:hypothetical protein
MGCAAKTDTSPRLSSARVRTPSSKATHTCGVYRVLIFRRWMKKAAVSKKNKKALPRKISLFSLLYRERIVRVFCLLHTCFPSITTPSRHPSDSHLVSIFSKEPSLRGANGDTVIRFWVGVGSVNCLRTLLWDDAGAENCLDCAEAAASVPEAGDWRGAPPKGDRPPRSGGR